MGSPDGSPRSPRARTTKALDQRRRWSRAFACCAPWQGSPEQAPAARSHAVSEYADVIEPAAGARSGPFGSDEHVGGCESILHADLGEGAKEQQDLVAHIAQRLPDGLEPGVLAQPPTLSGTRIEREPDDSVEPVVREPRDLVRQRVDPVRESKDRNGRELVRQVEPCTERRCSSQRGLESMIDALARCGSKETASPGSSPCNPE